MKKITLLSILLVTTFSFAQTENDKKIFLDSLFKETTEGNHKYYRIIKDYNLEKENYKSFEYLKSGKILSEGTYSDREAKTRNGEIIFYFENGNKKTLMHYNQNKTVGLEIEWYENGNKKSEAEFTNENYNTGRNYKINQFWNNDYKQTVIDGNGFYESNDQYYLNKGNIKNGLWSGVSYQNKYNYSEKYDNGTFVSGETIQEDGYKSTYSEKESVPKPKKGMQDFYSHLARNIKVPEKLRKTAGRIIIEFVVDQEGKIVEPKIVKSLHSELDNEAIKVLLNYENWIPGQQRGRNVRCKYMLPLNFKEN